MSMYGRYGGARHLKCPIGDATTTRSGQLTAIIFFISVIYFARSLLCDYHWGTKIL